MKKLILFIIAIFMVTVSFTKSDNHKPIYNTEEIKFVQSLLDQGYTILPEVTICSFTQDTIRKHRNDRPMMRPIIQSRSVGTQRPDESQQMNKKVQERKMIKEKVECDNPNPQPKRKMEQKKIQKRFERKSE